jgi:transposase
VAHDLGIGAVLDAALAPLVAERDALRVERDALRAERDALAVRLRRAEMESRRQRSEIDRLKAALEEALRAAKRQAAPFRRRRRKGRPGRPGRKPGHEPANRPVPDHVDEELYEPLLGCPCCGGEVEDVADLPPQFVIDLPPEIRLWVRRFHTQSGWCGHCRRRVRSRHPEQHSTATGAAGVQVGPRALALGVDLKHRIGIPYKKISGVFRLFFGVTVCAATWVRAEKRIAARLEPTYRALVETTRQSEVVHIDETGWYVTEATKKAWLWVFAVPEPKITLFAIRTSRGGEVAEEILGADFAGTIGIDGWAGYIQLLCQKGQCNGHLLRRARELLDVQLRGAARFPLAVERAILAGIAAKRLMGDLPPAHYAALCDQVRAEMQVLLAGRIEEPANRRFAQHLRNHADELHTFLDVPGLAPTNNFGEQEIRPAVVVRKISAGNRTLGGAHVHEIAASVSRTAERNGQDLALVLPDLLRSPTGYVLPVLPGWPRPPPQEDPHERRPVREGPLRSDGRNVRRRSDRPLPRLGADARPPPS